eukprot:4312958-Pleurochrysis_carterae.AAC.2
MADLKGARCALTKHVDAQILCIQRLSCPSPEKLSFTFSSHASTFIRASKRLPSFALMLTALTYIAL